MKRGRLKIAERRCYHVTHRCQERKFFLYFDIDRKKYVDRLREAKDRFPVDILDYMITSNHVHLLFYSESGKAVSDAMHFIQGATARDYNRRKEREGAFWNGRFRPTLIQDGIHLSRCILYISLNMLRSGAVKHPDEWKTCGYHELAGFRERKLIVNRERLLSCLCHQGDYDGFVDWYRKTIDGMANSTVPGRNPLWTESTAVGDLEWIESLAHSHVIGRKEVVSMREESPAFISCIRESSASYGLKISERFRNDFAFNKNR